MEDMSGYKISTSGMLIEIISDDGETLQCNNITTKQSLTMKKANIVRAIKLGKAEIETDQE